MAFEYAPVPEAPSPIAAKIVPSGANARPAAPATFPPFVFQDTGFFVSLVRSIAHTPFGVAPQPFDVVVYKTPST